MPPPTSQRPSIQVTSTLGCAVELGKKHNLHKKMLSTHWCTQTTHSDTHTCTHPLKLVFCTKYSIYIHVYLCIPVCIHVTNTPYLLQVYMYMYIHTCIHVCNTHAECMRVLSSLSLHKAFPPIHTTNWPRDSAKALEEWSPSGSKEGWNRLRSSSKPSR